MPAYLKLLYSSRFPSRVYIKSLLSYEHNYTAQTSTMIRAVGRILALTWIHGRLISSHGATKKNFGIPSQP
jgi:hypothetical protein